MPGNRTCVTSMNIGNYFRLSPDNRLIFGGRARFSATSDQRSDAKSGDDPRARACAEIFPQLAGVEIDYCWGGLVDMTKDRYPARRLSSMVSGTPWAIPATARSCRPISA